MFPFNWKGKTEILQKFFCCFLWLINALETLSVLSEQMTEAVRPNSMVFCSVTFQLAKKNMKISTPKGFHNVAKT